jgi:hypothetical protein
MQKAADFFERLRVPYRIVGSMASMAYGEARFTNDIVQRKDSEFGTLDITHGQRLKSDGLYDAWFGSPENVMRRDLPHLFWFL